MADINVLIVVDGVFNLSKTYPYQSPTGDSPDLWFTLSFLISALRTSTSPTFSVDTASRGFAINGGFPAQNDTPDPSATLKGPDPSNPTPFLFDDPSVNLLDYDEIWLFGDEGYDQGEVAGPQSGTVEPGRLSDSELAKITDFMQLGGGVFAVGDHDGLGAGMCGFIPRVRFMRKWFDAADESTGLPPSAATRNWGTGTNRMDTLVEGSTDSQNMVKNSTGDPLFYFDDQSDDRPQILKPLVPTHPVMQGATGVLTVYPDHMHEGEVCVPTGDMLTQTSASDPTLDFAGPDFTEFPSTPTGDHQEVPIVLAQATAGSAKHGTTVSGEDMACATLFGPSLTTAQNATLDVLAAYDGAKVNVGRIVTDSSFHHFLDLNLLGDPCSDTPGSDKRDGFNYSPTGQAHLSEIKAFYINLATWLAWTRNFYVGLGKNDYGRNEVSDHLSPFFYQDAFYVFLEGFTPNGVGSSPTITLSGTFNGTNIPGLVISAPTVDYDVGNSGANANVPQRIRFAYSIQFASESLNVFPNPGDPSAAFTLSASISIGNNSYQTPVVEFFLLGGADPYFTNVNPNADNRYYLSQDLRVFTITPTANNQTPIVDNQSPASAVPFAFQNGNPTTQDTAAAYTYINGLITYLNETYGYLNTDPNYTPPDTNTADPLDTLLPDQNGALNGDSSVTPKTGSNINYNFAIARVRLQGPSGQATAANSVKVFFRMFTTQTFDTDFIDSASALTSADPNVTYPPSGTNPAGPLPGTDGDGAINGCSLPFFATANFGANPSDYAAPPMGVNNQNIAIPNGNYAWAFFGCFLNVNDLTNVFGDSNSLYGQHPVQHWLAGSAHNCLVAQIAYDLAPIENVNGTIENPQNSDKLAQRNLQVTTSGNPGFPSTHRVPQTIDVRPSPLAQSTDRRNILSYPDEIMVDWGDTPRGSIARIYWPAASAASVLDLAKQLYPVNPLSAVDAHTIQCEVTSSVTYVPIPFGAGGSLAGLLTIDLPAAVRKGNEFNVLVHRITTRQLPARKGGADTSASRAAIAEGISAWRYVSGSFLATISVQRESEILPADENLLAILKWRLELIGPGNRWYPVLLRYISYLSGRINGMGGNASGILPSPDGYQPPSPAGKPPAEHEHVGKVIGIIYDRFGDFEGFTILSNNGREHRFRGREPQVEELVRRAWIERTLIRVLVESHDPDWPASIVLERWK